MRHDIRALALADFSALGGQNEEQKEQAVYLLQSLLLDEKACRLRIAWLRDAVGRARAYVPGLAPRPRPEFLDRVLSAVDEPGIIIAWRQGQIAFDELEALTRDPHALNEAHCRLLGHEAKPCPDEEGDEARSAQHHRESRTMFDFDWTGWTKWAPLIDLDIAVVPKGPGAYVIATDRPINRAVGTDPEGFLHVGESGKLGDRLWGFRECVTVRGAEWHMAGWRFAFFRFERHFPVSSLRARWAVAKTKAEAYRAEGRLLLAYLMRHGELPPLNYKFNWQAFEELGWDVFDDDTTDA